MTTPGNTDAREVKQALRAHFRQCRADMPAAVRRDETEATVRTLQSILDRSGLDVASYVAIGAELDLQQLHRWCWTHGRRLWLPRILSQRRLAWHPVLADTPLQPGAYGIAEPADTTGQPDLPNGATVLVPGVAFAEDGRRLGQGKGYYDRVLGTHAGLSIGIGFGCQRCDAIPVEAHDRSVQQVVLGGVRFPTTGGTGTGVPA